MANTASSFHFFDSNKGQPTESATRSGGSVLGADVTFKGSLKVTGDITIAGTFEGDISSEGRVTIAAGASIVGGITASEIVIGGKVQGNSIANKSLSLLSTSEARGDVTTPQLVIEPGATFVGRCSMPQVAQKA